MTTIVYDSPQSDAFRPSNNNYNNVFIGCDKISNIFEIPDKTYEKNHYLWTKLLRLVNGDCSSDITEKSLLHYLDFRTQRAVSSVIFIINNN